MSFDTFSQNTSMAKLIQGQGHDGSAFDEEYLSSIRGIFCSKNREYQYFGVCYPETSSCASKPLLLRCNLVIPQCMCKVSLRLKEVQMGTHDFKYNKVLIFGRKTGNINTSMSAAPKLALVPASSYYCDVT